MREEAALTRTSRPSKTWLTGTAWASLLVFAAASTLLSVSLKQIGTDLAIGYSLRGTVALARCCVLALSTFAVGYTADRLGKRWLLAGGMVVVAGGLWCVGFTSAFAGLMVGTMVAGAGLGCLEGLASPLIADLHPARVEMHMNVLHAFFPVGIVVFSLVIGRALDLGVPWRLPFAVAALPALAVGVMFAVGTYPEDPSGRRRRPLPIRCILARPLFWLLAVAMALTAGCEGTLIYWTPNFVQDVYGQGALVGAAGLTAFTAAMAVGRVASGIVARFVPLPRIMLAMALLDAVLALALVLTRDLAVSMRVLALVGLCTGCFWPGILTVATRRIAAGSATLLAMISVAGIAGFGVVPWLVGLVAESRGLRTGFALLPVVLLAATAVLGLAFRLEASAVRLEPPGDSERPAD